MARHTVVHPPRGRITQDVAAFMKMESEIQAYYRSYGRDQLYSLVVRQTLLERVGAAASELLHRRLQSTDAHIRPETRVEERPCVSGDPVVTNVHLSIRAAKRLLEMDRLLKTSAESDVSIVTKFRVRKHSVCLQVHRVCH